ncbi:sensor histidine kinase [Rhizohabitans arisaemae]|uniref:sensor histidine kinase n=1 Tax=Rhizohabitans arisaemae TaxID=2720610 RepID=UPI0024B1027C|nr:HAMP domain-containing sensor histidine kinase [Rhizohabitans arisaemae]
MRRRIHIVFQTVIALTLVCLMLPLGISSAGSLTRSMFIDRQADTNRYAEIGKSTLLTGDIEPINQEFTRYKELYGIHVVLFDRYSKPTAFSESGLENLPTMATKVAVALSGEEPILERTSWPWEIGPMIIAVPILLDDETIGAAVTVSSTTKLRQDILGSWALFLCLGLFIVLAARNVVPWLTRWILRPVLSLDQAAKAITRGELSSRARMTTGPPELWGLVQSFNTMSETIQDLVNRQRTFVSFASHQLRSPLTVLRLQVENLGAGLEPERTPEVQAILDEVDRLALLCHGLLGLATAESEELVLTVVDLGAVADQSVVRWQPIADQREIELHRIGDPVAPVQAGEGVVDQVLDTMLDNALKFSGPGSQVTVGVHVGADGWTEVHVIDDGPGMSEAERKHAADPFWRGSKTQNVDGSGLGLAICTTLVSRSGGKIELYSAEPHGLMACVRLRAADAPAKVAVPVVAT